MKKIYSPFIAVLTILVLLPLSGFKAVQNDQNEAEKYFTVFLGKNGNDLAEVFLQHQPSLNDCKIVFTDEYYKTAFQNINQMYAGLSEQMDTQNERFKNKSACRATPFTTDEVIANTCKPCPGIMFKIADKFRPGVTCYRLEFLETAESEFGSSYAFFTKINERWVYFPMN